MYIVDGIMYSKITKIFYKMIKNELHMLRIYTDVNSVADKFWIKSYFKDYNKMSKNFVRPTEEQYEKYNLKGGVFSAR